jgi:hypothetical protein
MHEFCMHQGARGRRGSIRPARGQQICGQARQSGMGQPGRPGPFDLCKIDGFVLAPTFGSQEQRSKPEPGQGGLGAHLGGFPGHGQAMRGHDTPR